MIKVVQGSIKIVDVAEGTIVFGPLSKMKKVFPNDTIIHLAPSPPWIPSFPLRDMTVEPFWNFKAAFKVSLKVLERTRRVMLACVGGRGRSGAVASALLTYLDRLDLVEELYHSHGSPETQEQLEAALVVGEIAREFGLDALDNLEYDGVLVWKGVPIHSSEFWTLR